MTTIRTLYQNIANAITSYFARRSERIEARKALLALEHERRTKRAKAGIEVANAQIEIAALLSEMAAARKNKLRKFPQEGASQPKFPNGGIVQGPNVDDREWIIPPNRIADLLKYDELTPEQLAYLEERQKARRRQFDITQPPTDGTTVKEDLDFDAEKIRKAAETWRKLNSNPAVKSKRDRINEVWKWADESETPIPHSEVIEKIRAILDEEPKPPTT